MSDPPPASSPPLTPRAMHDARRAKNLGPLHPEDADLNHPYGYYAHHPYSNHPYGYEYGNRPDGLYGNAYYGHGYHGYGSTRYPHNAREGYWHPHHHNDAVIGYDDLRSTSPSRVLRPIEQGGDMHILDR